MGYRSPFPNALQQVEYVKLDFHLEIETYFDLPPLGLLQLRRELLQALKARPADDDRRQLEQLLQPDLPTDPVLVRQVQKPAPALVFTPDISQYGLIEPKQQIILPVLFVGSGVRSLIPFVSLMQQLEKQGLYHSHGNFRLKCIDVEDGSGAMSRLWSTGDSFSCLTPPVNHLAWWLERLPPVTHRAEFKVISPIRILHQGKPLFTANFAALFPFILRRVSALVAAHAGVELVDDPGSLLALAAQVKSVGRPLPWKDWRTLKSRRGNQHLGGLMGTLTLEGIALDELWWLLSLGQLFNIGKGAAYGAGQYRITYS